jgi:hypothetical protein
VRTSIIMSIFSTVVVALDHFPSDTSSFSVPTEVLAGAERSTKGFEVAKEANESVRSQTLDDFR